MNPRTELDFIFEGKDDPSFTKAFYRDFWICVAIGFSASIGLIFAVLNADVIDKMMVDLLKSIFI